ncbi:hypothetical protein BASA50_008311 [Batrachochytrium salamandrivorans]|uniref:Uncharacterized protein n=1 Tax=Batrachochytrium salamandrivorans TaxID=1357716 RepID=A0ABQ8F7F2_9FUNG|nr:hypothetical protein BASA50_008311 [Batrachochytrium salamandrivorans]
MRLAIASTTILFAMMAAQAAVLSAAPATDVNLVKRAPNGDEMMNKALWPTSLAPTQLPNSPWPTSLASTQLPKTPSRKTNNHK